MNTKEITKRANKFSYKFFEPILVSFTYLLLLVLINPKFIINVIYSCTELLLQCGVVIS